MERYYDNDLIERLRLEIKSESGANINENQLVELEAWADTMFTNMKVDWPEGVIDAATLLMGPQSKAIAGGQQPTHQYKR